MCNLYNITTSQEAIRRWTRALRDILGNLEPSIDIYPNQLGPVVRNAADGDRKHVTLLWGMPTPPERVRPIMAPRQVADKRGQLPLP